MTRLDLPSYGAPAEEGAGAAATVPTLWIVLGPLGQSITAGHTLAGTAAQVLPAPYGVGAEVAALCTACRRGASRCSGRRWPALLGAWVVVAARTVHGVVDGHLLRAPA